MKAKSVKTNIDSEGDEKIMAYAHCLPDFFVNYVWYVDQTDTLCMCQKSTKLQPYTVGDGRR